MQNITQLIYRHAVLNNKKMSLFALTILIIFTLIFFLQSFLSGQINAGSLQGWYMTVFVIAGYYHSTQVFNDLTVPAKSYHYLMLPASNAEKFISGWLITSVLYVIAGIALYYLSMMLGGLLAYAVRGTELVEGSLAQSLNPKTIAVYMVIQTIFLAGGLVFRTNAFVKTILSMVLFSIAVVIATSITGHLVIGTRFWEMEKIFNGTDLNEAAHYFTEVVPIVAKILFWGITGPLFLLTGYFKLKEIEV